MGVWEFVVYFGQQYFGDVFVDLCLDVGYVYVGQVVEFVSKFIQFGNCVDCDVVLDLIGGYGVEGYIEELVIWVIGFVVIGEIVDGIDQVCGVFDGIVVLWGQ